MPHKYRVAIIGAGMICNAAHLPALTPLRKRGAVEVVAVADIRPEAARETAQRYEIPAWYDDPQKMLDEVKPGLGECVYAQSSPQPQHSGAAGRG